MKKSLHTIVLIMVFNFAADAQLGASISGITIIGTGNLRMPVIGNAVTQVCVTPGSCGKGRVVYTFKGSGNWNIAGNWYGNAIPPPLLLAHALIIIDPPAAAECVFTVPMQIIPPGTDLKLMPGKKLRVMGKLVK